MTSAPKPPPPKAITDQSDETGYIHVYPTTGREHVLKGTTCWCHPVVDEVQPDVLIHNQEN